MKLTADEKKICRMFGKRWEDGRVRCSACPLVISTKWCMCKKNSTEEEWAEHLAEMELIKKRKEELGL